MKVEILTYSKVNVTKIHFDLDYEPGNEIYSIHLKIYF